MARYSWQVQCACTIARLSPCTLWPFFHFRWKVEMRKWLVNNTSVYFFSSPGLLEHDFVKKTAREKRWSARVSRLKCTRSPRPVDRAVGRNAPSRTQKIMGAVRITSWYPKFMEAILTCHPALSTKWLDGVAKWCERWRMRTGPILQVVYILGHLSAPHRPKPTQILQSHTVPIKLRGRGAVTHSCSALSQCLHASISMLISRCFIVCFVWISVRLHVRRLHRCLLRIRPLASEKRLHQMKTCAARQWNLRQHPTLALLEHFEAPWRSQALLLPGASFSTVMVKHGSVPIMENFEPIFLRSVNECGPGFSWKYSQDTAFQEIPRRNSVLYFWAGPLPVEVAVRTASWLVSAISHPRGVCAPMLMLGKSEFLVGKSTTVVLI